MTYYPECLIKVHQKHLDQKNKCKTQKWSDKYSDIELYKNKYKSFKLFCDECDEFFSWFYIGWPTEQSIQDVFDNLEERWS